MIFLEEDFTEGEYRSALAVVERRDSGPDCGRQEGGRFGPGNKCQEDAGTGEQDKPSPSSRRPSKSESGSPGGSLRWTPGDTMPDVFAESVASNPTVRTSDGKGIKSTSIPGAVVTRALGGKYEVDPVSVGRYLAARQAEHRGRPIDTTKPLSGDDFEYMVSGITSQVESAMARGVAPNFYSPEDRRVQVEEYAKIQPLMRGGRTASGFCIGREGPNGECEPSGDISPQAEFLFRAAQALTSPQANPFENMLRADQVLTAFFTEPDPERARLGRGIRIAGANDAGKNFERLQKIIDRIGLDETRRLFAGPPMRVGDFERFFLNQIPGSEGATYTPNEYAVDEVVPRFSIFGPKVGPFFANNTGDIDSLTADIWFTRTWGRLSGEIIDESSPSLAKKYATSLMASTKDIDREVLSSIGLDGRQFRTYVSQMKKSGEMPQAVISWAEKTYKQYSKDGFPSHKKGTGTPERYKLDRLAVNILGNQTSVLDVPSTTVMRTNMIRVMKEASRRTGVPVAYMQDILWQDEQDAWGTLGSRTSTVPGEPSIYSDVIRKIVENQDRYRRLPKPAGKAKASSRSVDGVQEPVEYPFLSDQKGGIEQALYDDFVSEMDDDEFADLAIAFLKSARVGASRAFCPTGKDGGVDNSCSAYQGGHKPPSESYGAPAHDLARLLPEDVYSQDAGRLYGHADPSIDEKTAAIVRGLKGKPDAPVRIYRAVPKSATGSINPGDWVTVNQDYAKQHGESALRGDYKVVSRVVTAKDIYTNGDSIHEWGYRPSERRSADCGANAPGGGGFQKGNKCAGDGDGSGEASSRIASGEKPSKVLQDMGYRKMNFSAIDKMLEKASDEEKAAILSDLDALAGAIKIEPSLADVPIRVGRMKEIYANRGDDLKGLLSETSETKLLSAVADVDGQISVFTDDGSHDESEFSDGWSTSKGGASILVHELAHISHFKSASEAFPYPGEDELPGVDPVDYSLTMAESAGTELLKSDKALRDKVAKVSEYATTDVFEFVAEYSTAVKLGDMRNDKDLDRLCKTVGAKPPKRIAK